MRRILAFPLKVPLGDSVPGPVCHGLDLHSMRLSQERAVRVVAAPGELQVPRHGGTNQQVRRWRSAAGL